MRNKVYFVGHKIITKENFSTGETLEQALNEIYRPENFDKLRPPPLVKRVGAAGAGYSNESLFPERMQLYPPPNGYIIGTGNGAIWSMLELFPLGTSPKGIISLDYDPSVVLGGKIIVELGKRGVLRKEAIAWLYGTTFEETRGKKYYHTVDEFIAIAKGVVKGEQNPKVRRVFIDSIEKGNFRKDADFMRETHVSDYNMPLFERGGESFEIKGRINTAGILYKHWKTVSKLAKEGEIIFLYVDMGDKRTLKFIDEKVPNIKAKGNIIYTSNIVDTRYREELNGLEIFNPKGESWYVYTTKKPDTYTLKASHTPPSYPDFH